MPDLSETLINARVIVLFMSALIIKECAKVGGGFIKPLLHVL
jgi:hypothetical protein